MAATASIISQRPGLVAWIARPKPATAARWLATWSASASKTVQRQLQPVALLGVDGQVDVGGGGQVDQRRHPWHQFGEHAVELAFLVARVQGAQLDRDAVALGRALADGLPAELAAMARMAAGRPRR
jgi:hypothetical protein